MDQMAGHRAPAGREMSRGQVGKDEVEEEREGRREAGPPEAVGPVRRGGTPEKN